MLTILAHALCVAVLAVVVGRVVADGVPVLAVRVLGAGLDALAVHAGEAGLQRSGII